jgi:hypothetical protein
MRIVMMNLVVLALGAVVTAVSPAWAQDDNSRAVRIIGVEPSPANPATSGRPAAATINQAALKADNPAGLNIQVHPGTELPVGAKVTFTITSKKAGYLVLVDVDASGKLRQIYPNTNALLTPDRTGELSNRIKANETITVPDPKSQAGGVEYVVSAPTGVAMVVAILGDRPVQVLDLPDVPTALVGQGGALKYLADFAHNLRIAQVGDTRRFAQPTWSFDAKFYVVK